MMNLYLLSVIVKFTKDYKRLKNSIFFSPDNLKLIRNDINSMQK